MTGKEAIRAVYTMTRADREQARQSDDATLALVASWPDSDPDGWVGVLDALNLAPNDWREGPRWARRPCREPGCPRLFTPTARRQRYCEFCKARHRSAAMVQRHKDGTAYHARRGTPSHAA